MGSVPLLGWAFLSIAPDVNPIQRREDLRIRPSQASEAAAIDGDGGAVTTARPSLSFLYIARFSAPLSIAT
jgi:hypothetical protein